MFLLKWKDRLNPVGRGRHYPGHELHDTPDWLWQTGSTRIQSHGCVMFFIRFHLFEDSPGSGHPVRGDPVDDPQDA